jgi:hypothetical protein
MPKTDKPHRKPLLIRLSAEECDRVARVQLYLGRGTLAGAIRAAIDIAEKAIDRFNGK